MRHNKKVKKLGKTAAHRKAMLRNMLTSLFKNEKIVTTEAKAKFARPFAEKMITKAMKGTLDKKRQVINYLKEREVANSLIHEIAPRYADKPTGGYTRIIKMGPRIGDGAKMAVLELVDPETRKASKKRFKKAKNKNTAKKAEVKEAKNEKVEEKPEEVEAEKQDTAENNEAKE